MTKSLTLNVGVSKQLTLKADGKSVAKKAKWSTSSKKIVTVKKGKVTAKAPGVATVSAKFGGKTAKVKITVVGLSSTRLTMNAGQTKKINMMSGKKAVTKGVTWSSSNASVVAVSNGSLTAKAAGKATITAKYKKKAFKCVVTVKSNGGGTDPKDPTDPKNPKKAEIKLSQKSATIDTGAKLNLELYEGDNKVTDQATWTTDNAEVATVRVSKRDDINKIPAYGVVLGQYNGKTTITATYKNVAYQCEVTVKNGFNPSTDMTVVPGSRTDYIEFKINKAVITPEELEDQGYTISEDRSTASMWVTSETATYKFTKLPKTLTEIKMIPRDTKFGPTAAGICAIATYTKDNYVSSQNVKNYDEELTFEAAFEYINGPSKTIANLTKQNMLANLNNAFGYTTNVVSGGPYMFFKGASNTNSYKPDVPYTFTLWEGPYYIPAKSSTIANPGGEPELRMIFVKPDGDDAERYLDTYKSKDGTWYLWDAQVQHFTAGMKSVQETDW